jgi:hypothetical protein
LFDECPHDVVDDVGVFGDEGGDLVAEVADGVLLTMRSVLWLGAR